MSFRALFTGGRYATRIATAPLSIDRSLLRGASQPMSVDFAKLSSLVIHSVHTPTPDWRCWLAMRFAMLSDKAACALQ